MNFKLKAYIKNVEEGEWTLEDEDDNIIMLASTRELLLQQIEQSPYSFYWSIIDFSEFN